MSAAIDPRDRALQAVMPAVMVPRFSQVDFPDTPGDRYLVASDGLWLDVRRSWLHVRLPVSLSKIALPYGSVEPILSCTPRVGSGLIRRFVEWAAMAAPNETAAYITHDAVSGSYTLHRAVIRDSGPGHVQYELPALDENEELAVDLHSHGDLPAFFSPQDDRDDHGAVKLAIVVGACRSATPQVRARLCCLGMTLDVTEYVNQH